MTLEKQIERKLKKEVEKLGGLCLKWISPGTNGVPDRIALLEGNTYFVELKTRKGLLSKVQEEMHYRLIRHGFKVFVINDLETLKQFIDEIRTT